MIMKLTCKLTISILFFMACKKEELVVIVPNTEISYSLADSIKIDSIYFNRFVYEPTYSNLNRKVYSTSNNKTSMHYYASNDSVILKFVDTTENNLTHDLLVLIKNKTVNTISGTYDLTRSNICIVWSQQVKTNGTVSVYSCIQIVKGMLIVSYDVMTNTMSGRIVGLRYPFGIYLPYAFNQSSDNVLGVSPYAENSGSTRNQEITFKNVKKG